MIVIDNMELPTNCAHCPCLCVTSDGYKCGTPYGWGEVLDYIGIPWRDPEHWWLNSEIKEQISIFDYLTNDGYLIETEGA